MLNKDRFSDEYRRDLAARLMEAPKRERMTILYREQPSLDYRLALAERTAIRRGVDFEVTPAKDQAGLHVDPRTNGKPEYFMSNEPLLSRLFPLIRKNTGAVVGVGTDQVLDIFVNGRFDCACLVDYTRTTSLLSRALLEVGVHHRKVFGRYPDPDQFSEYFQDKNSHHLNRVLAPAFSDKDRFDLTNQLTYGRRGDYNPSSLGYCEYLDFRKRGLNAGFGVYNWLYCQSLMARVFEAYEAGRIAVVHGDIGDKKVVENVDRFLEAHNSRLSTLYLSNAEEYYSRSGYLDASPYLGLRREQSAVIFRTTTRAGDMVDYDTPGNMMSTKVKRVMYSWHYNAQTLRDYQKYSQLDTGSRIQEIHKDIRLNSLTFRQLRGLSFLGMSRDRVRKSYASVWK